MGRILMKIIVLNIILLLSSNIIAQHQINWVSFEEAVETNKTEPKLMLIDVYTSWCGYCKKMDRTTFQDSVMIDFLNDNFHCAKVNAEMRSDVIFNGDTLGFIKDWGRNGVHELAARLLDGKMGYPAFVVLNKNLSRIEIIKGFNPVESFGPKLEKIWKTYGLN
jgi:thioredoxin-related protein